MALDCPNERCTLPGVFWAWSRPGYRLYSLASFDHTCWGEALVHHYFHLLLLFSGYSLSHFPLSCLLFLASPHPPTPSLYRAPSSHLRFMIYPPTPNCTSASDPDLASTSALSRYYARILGGVADSKNREPLLLAVLTTSPFVISSVRSNG